MIETKSPKTISTCSNKFPLVTVKSVRIIFIAPPMMMDTKNLIGMKNLELKLELKLLDNYFITI